MAKAARKILILAVIVGSITGASFARVEQRRPVSEPTISAVGIIVAHSLIKYVIGNLDISD